jgi:bacillithiol synthase
MNQYSLRGWAKELRLGDLPGFSRFYTDYADCTPPALQFFSCRPEFETIVQMAGAFRPRGSAAKDIFRGLHPSANSEAVLANYRRLCDPEVRVVWVTQPTGLLGGPFVNILRCLTAIRLARELDNRGIPTVPVCETNANLDIAENQFLVRILDHEGKPRELLLDNSDAMARSAGGDFLIPPQIDEFFALLSAMISDLPGSELLEFLREIYRPGVLLSDASAQLTTRVFEDQGLVVLNAQQAVWQSFWRREVDRLGIAPEQMEHAMLRVETDLAQAGYDIRSDKYLNMLRTNILMLPVLRHSALPVVAVVGGPDEVEWTALLRPVYEELGIAAPTVWPQASATVITGKEQKALEKYNIGVLDALAGTTATLGRINSDLGAYHATDQFRGLAERIRDGMDSLKTLAEDDDGFRESIGSSSEKMLYQVGKITDRLDLAVQERLAAMGRRLESLFNSIAPNGLLQERGLSAAHFLFRYAPGFISNLVEQIDILYHRHQLIMTD